VSLSNRDRKIVIFILPVLVLVGFWFLLLAPKRQEASKAAKNLAKQEQRRDQAQAAVAAAEASKDTFAADYGSLVKLGKAVPTQLDMPTVIVQLQAAADGTGTDFTRIATGERDESAAPAAPQPPAAPGSGDGSQPAAAGGAPAASAPGGAVESAGNSVNNANGASAAAEQSGVSPADTQTSTSNGGGLPVGGGGTPGAPGGAAGGGAPGLDSVPLELEFQASFFKLADFFHRLKRFVDVAQNRINVRGRLLTVESLSFKSEPELFPKLTAEVKAIVYLTPQTEGVTAGATPNGPATAVPTGASQPGATPPASPAPTATATP
jgi:hypothetical protein